ARQRADLFVAQFGCDRRHDVEHAGITLVGGAGAVFLEATRGVPGLLATDVRVGRARVAGARWAVAGHAGRDAALEVAAAEQLLADLVELHALVGAFGDHGVVGDAGRGHLAGVMGADIAHVLRRKHRSEGLHDRAGALAALEQRQLAGHVALALAADVGVDLADGGLAVQAVACGAGAGERGAVLGIAGRGRGQFGQGVHRLQRQGLHRLGLLQRGDRGLGESDGTDRQGGESGEEVAAGVTHLAGLRESGLRAAEARGRKAGHYPVAGAGWSNPPWSPARAILCPMANPLARAEYMMSAHTPRQLPPEGGFEVAFAGRSNAGKSSALNALCQQNALARVSKTPGRTQQLVFFNLPQYEGKYLVDLPGYGYAKVPKDLQAHWQAFLDVYFKKREALRGLVVVMDIRHPLKD